MIDLLFYLGVGLLLYSYKNNRFDWDKPWFWGVVLGWPAVLLFTFFQTYIEVIKEYEDKK